LILKNPWLFWAYLKTYEAWINMSYSL
jgi:hypothetical protein